MFCLPGDITVLRLSSRGDVVVISLVRREAGQESVDQVAERLPFEQTLIEIGTERLLLKDFAEQ